ncbi:hypothetical protein ACFL18_00625 [Patescibacteria group bacterium]
MAYLISITSGKQFKGILAPLLSDSLVSNKLHDLDKGVSLTEMVEVTNKHSRQLEVEVVLIDWEKEPKVDPPFIIGVKQLPSVSNLEADQLQSVESAKQDGSLVEQDQVWQYPGGHAITIVKSAKDEVEYFDSYLGKEVAISRSLFLEGLHDNGRLIKVKQ